MARRIRGRVIKTSRSTSNPQSGDCIEATRSTTYEEAKFVYVGITQDVDLTIGGTAVTFKGAPVGTILEVPATAWDGSDRTAGNYTFCY